MGNGILDGYETDSAHVAPIGADRASGMRVQLPLGKFNRHGIVSGATGTGKTRTIQQMMEWCAMNGVPCLAADGKGDMSGMAKEGVLSGKARQRLEMTDQSEWWEGTSVPVQFLALGGRGAGVAVRTTVGSYGYKPLAKLMKLSPAQTAALHTVFREATLMHETLETMDDLRDYIRSVREDAEISVSPRVCDNLTNAINLFEDNNPGLFGGPEFDVMDLIRDDDGWGMVSLIDSSQLQDSPEVVTTFILWMVNQLYRALPEVGDQEKPKLVLFLDEANTMFQDAPKEFIREFEQTIKRIRSKGVGIFLISQSAADIPDKILEQCANRIQHAVRANTPEQRRRIKKTVDTFPVSAVYDIEKELVSMAIGEALVCLIDDDGRPTPPSVALIYTPCTSMSPLTDDELREHVRGSLLFLKYRDMEREYKLAREDAVFPPAPPIRQREVTPNPVAAALGRILRNEPHDAIPVVIDDDPWNT